MAQKLFVNNTPYTIEGTIVVRKGNTPGQELDTLQIDLTPGPGSEQMVQYGDANDPYIDQLTLSGMDNGGLIISDQVVITKSSELDNLFNQNDTVYIALENQSFVVTTANTWTT